MALALMEPLPAILMVVLPMPTTVLKAEAEALPVMVLERTRFVAEATLLMFPLTMLRSVLTGAPPAEVSEPNMPAVMVVLADLASPVVVLLSVTKPEVAVLVTLLCPTPLISRLKRPTVRALPGLKLVAKVLPPELVRPPVKATTSPVVLFEVVTLIARAVLVTLPSCPMSSFAGSIGDTEPRAAVPVPDPLLLMGTAWRTAEVPKPMLKMLESAEEEPVVVVLDVSIGTTLSSAGVLETSVLDVSKPTLLLPVMLPFRPIVMSSTKVAPALKIPAKALVSPVVLLLLLVPSALASAVTLPSCAILILPLPAGEVKVAAVEAF